MDLVIDGKGVRYGAWARPQLTTRNLPRPTELKIHRCHRRNTRNRALCLPEDELPQGVTAAGRRRPVWWSADANPLSEHIAALRHPLLEGLRVAALIMAGAVVLAVPGAGLASAACQRCGQCWLSSVYVEVARRPWYRFGSILCCRCSASSCRAMLVGIVVLALNAGLRRRGGGARSGRAARPREAGIAPEPDAQIMRRIVVPSGDTGHAAPAGNLLIELMATRRCVADHHQ